MARRFNASSGHKLGQLVGDWFERYFVLPLLEKVSDELGLYLDHRFKKRPARGDKILWRDEDGNIVDYDFVLELKGADEKIGIPVGFMECFWRRGSRHSKDKARDDSGKLLPMRKTYPSARFLGIIASGTFTAPARELILSRKIDLFYLPKERIVEAFAHHGLIIDYPDTASEKEKRAIAKQFGKQFSESRKVAVSQTLYQQVGHVAIDSYLHRVRATLSSLPQEIRLILRDEYAPMIFDSVGKVSDFLEGPSFDKADPKENYLYQITYSDGTDFEGYAASLEQLKRMHEDIAELTDHMNRL